MGEVRGETLKFNKARKMNLSADAALLATPRTKIWTFFYEREESERKRQREEKSRKSLTLPTTETSHKVQKWDSPSPNPS